MALPKVQSRIPETRKNGDQEAPTLESDTCRGKCTLKGTPPHAQALLNFVSSAYHSLTSGSVGFLSVCPTSKWTLAQGWGSRGEWRGVGGGAGFAPNWVRCSLCETPPPPSLMFVD